MRICHLIPLAISIVFLTSPLAGAQQDDETQAEAASRAFTTGTKLFKERRYINAIAAFELAYRLKPHFQVQCSIARCFENINNMVKAALHYQRCLKEGAESSPMAKRIRASLATVQTQITWVMVHSPGKGGTVHVDGQPKGQAPRRIPIDPGSHVIEVRRPGAKTAKSTLKTLGGEERELTLTPIDLQPSVAVRPTPVLRKKEKTTSPPSRRRLSPVWFWSAVGVTGALAVTAVVLGAQTLGLRSDYEEDPTEEGYDDFVDRRLVTNVFWALSAAAAGAGTVVYFYTDFGDRREIKPAATGSRARVLLGAGLRGSF